MLLQKRTDTYKIMCVRACVRACTCMRVRVRVCVCVHACACVCVRVRVSFVHVYLHIYTCVCVHVCVQCTYDHYKSLYFSNLKRAVHGP